MMIKPLLMLAIAGTLLALPAQATSPAAALNSRLVEACATPPDMPSLVGLSASEAKQTVDRFAQAANDYQACLYETVRENRKDMTNSEQALFAARLSKVSYMLHSLRLEQAQLVRSNRVTEGQVAERIPG